MRLRLGATKPRDLRPGTRVRGGPRRTGHLHRLGVLCGRADTQQAGESLEPFGS